MIMVGQLSDSKNHSKHPVPVAVRLTKDHNIQPQTIRELIKGALDPLVVDPIPSRIVINDIAITNDGEGRLSIECRVLIW